MKKKMGTKQDHEGLVPQALALLVEQMLKRPDDFSVEEGRKVDAALRSCVHISDVDRIWVRWGYIASERGWSTASDLVWTKKGYLYPKSFFES